jgi:hypothetical protein
MQLAAVNSLGSGLKAGPAATNSLFP